MRGPELNMWFLWNLRKLGKHEIDNFKAAPLASVWLRAKFEAIDLKMFFYFSQYVNNIYFYNLGFALSLVLKATYFETRKWPFSVPCEQRFLSCMAFSVYEVIRVACLSHSWFVYSTWTGTNQLRTDKPSEWLRKHLKPCKRVVYWAIKCSRWITSNRFNAGEVATNSIIVGQESVCDVALNQLMKLKRLGAINCYWIIKEPVNFFLNIQAYCHQCHGKTWCQFKQCSKP